MGNSKHFTPSGRPQMADLSDTPLMRCQAKAVASVRMSPDTLAAVLSGQITGGDPLAVASIGGILGVKHACDIIPLNHPVAITAATVEFEFHPREPVIEVIVTV